MRPSRSRTRTSNCCNPRAFCSARIAIFSGAGAVLFGSFVLPVGGRGGAKIPWGAGTNAKLAYPDGTRRAPLLVSRIVDDVLPEPSFCGLTSCGCFPVSVPPLFAILRIGRRIDMELTLQGGRDDWIPDLGSDFLSVTLLIAIRVMCRVLSGPTSPKNSSIMSKNRLSMSRSGLSSLNCIFLLRT